MDEKRRAALAKLHDAVNDAKWKFETVQEAAFVVKDDDLDVLIDIGIKLGDAMVLIEEAQG